MVCIPQSSLRTYVLNSSSRRRICQRSAQPGHLRVLLFIRSTRYLLPQGVKDSTLCYLSALLVPDFIDAERIISHGERELARGGMGETKPIMKVDLLRGRDPVCCAQVGDLL